MDEPFILSQFARLVNSGTVLYDTQQATLEVIDRDLKFQFCLTSALAQKPTIKTNQPPLGDDTQLRQERLDGSDIDTLGFEIGHINQTHFLAANKFCWAKPHLLVLTRDKHQRQYEPLYGSDLEAMWSVLSTLSGDYVAFYNCGREGGCSRLHKHMQVIPTPENWFASFLDSAVDEPKVPFHWFYHRFNSPNVTLCQLIKVYKDLLERATAIGVGGSKDAATSSPSAAFPHNMILTKRWMIVLPRRQAAVNQEAAANAVGMLGYIAVAIQREIDSWKQLGLTDSLKELGVPK